MTSQVYDSVTIAFPTLPNRPCRHGTWLLELGTPNDHLVHQTWIFVQIESHNNMMLSYGYYQDGLWVFSTPCPSLAVHVSHPPPPHPILWPCWQADCRRCFPTLANLPTPPPSHNPLPLHYGFLPLNSPVADCRLVSRLAASGHGVEVVTLSISASGEAYNATERRR